MELNLVLEQLKEPEKIVSPAQCNTLISYLTGFIGDYEETLHEMNLQVSNRWLAIRETVKSDSRADRALEIDSVYRERESLKLKLSQLRRLRSDLRSRLEILMNIKRFN